MEKDFLLCQIHRAERKGNSKKEIKAFRDHTDDRTDHRNDRFTDRLSIQGDRLNEKSHTERDDHDTGDLDDQLDIIDHLGLLILDLTGFGRELGCVAVTAYRSKTGGCFSRDNKGTGHELGTFGLFDLVRFTGKKRFIDIQSTLDDLTVRRDLLSAGKMDDIVLGKLIHRHRDRLAVTIDFVGCLCKNIQIIQHLFGTELLEDTDTGVRDDDRQERQAPVGSGDDQKHRDDRKYQVKIGEYIFADNG